LHLVKYSFSDEVFAPFWSKKSIFQKQTHHQDAAPVMQDIYS